MDHHPPPPSRPPRRWEHAFASWLRRTNLWHLLWISMVLAELFTALIVASMSVLFHGRITADYLITGAVAAFWVSLIVVALLIYLVRQLQESEHREKQALDAGNRAKSEFLATMSHEIRTPMTAIIGMSELLKESELDEQGRARVETIANAGEGLLALLDDILDLSKVEAGHLEPEAIPFHVGQTLEEVREILRIPAETRGLKLSVEIAPGLHPHRHGDPRLLRQVLINLTGNAIKFTHEGSVRLSLDEAPREQRLRFSVSDTGIGIPPEKQELIFDPFAQSDTSICREYGGSGLGLSISKRLVGAMGGTIGVESEPERGSTFHFSLPMRRADTRPLNREREATDEGGEPPSSHPRGERPLNILLADDNPDNIALFLAYLQGSSHHIVTADDGARAVERFKEDRFDLVLMDIQMPVMDGYSAIRAIRQWEAHQRPSATPILALTAHALESDHDQSLAAGCDGHLTKPIRKAHFLREIERHATSD